MLAILSGQRRRLLFFAVSMAIGLLFIGLLPGLRWYSKLISFLLAPVVMAAIAAAVLAYYPSKRGWLECIGAGTFLGGLLGSFTALDGLIGLPLAALFSAGLVMLGHEGWKHLLKVSFPYATSAQGQISADGAELWAAVVPGAAPRLTSARLIDVETDPDCNDTFYAGLMAFGELAEEVTLTVLERDSAGRVRIHIEGEDAEGTLSSGVLSLTISEIDPDTSHLSLEETREGMTPGEAVERWFDDPLGCEIRHLQAHFLKLNPPTPTARDATDAGLPADTGTVEATTGQQGVPMQNLATLPEDHLTLEAVRKAVRP